MRVLENAGAPEMVQHVERVLAAEAVKGQRRTSIDTFVTPEV